MKKIVYLLLFFTAFLNAQTEVAIKSVANTTIGPDGTILVKVYVPFDRPTQNISVNYTITGDGADNITATSGVIALTTDVRYGFQNHIVIESNETVVGTETFTITLTSGTGYILAPSNSVTLSVSDTNPPKAFPSAYGAGAFTTGGRGGTIVHVTSLEDHPDDPQEGTFRWAMQRNFPRIIVFDVSGTIELKKGVTNTAGTLFISNGDFTVAGQTAPIGGITITGEVYMSFNHTENHPNLDNMIFRHINSRPFWRDDPTAATGLTILNAVNIVVDHCSFGFGKDKGASFLDISANYTVSNNLFAENGTGMLMGLNIDGASDRRHRSFNNSVFNNIFYDSGHRTPNGIGKGRLDVINNVGYNCNFRLSNFIGGVKANVINNYYDRGTRGVPLGSQGQKIQGDGFIDDFNEMELYYDGNVVNNWNPTSEFEHVTIFNDFTLNGTNYTAGQLAPESDFRTLTKHAPLTPEPPIIASGSGVLDALLQDIGANKSLNADGSVSISQSTLDTDYIAKMTAREYSGYTWQFDYRTQQNYIDFIASISTTPVNSRPANYYISNPHIPEAYLDARQADLTAEGISKTDTDVHNHIMPSGYTLIEEFFNEVDVEYVVEGITPSDTTQNSTTITWNAVTGATSYVVYRDEVQQSIVTNGTAYNDSNLTANTTYNYKVDARDVNDDVLGSSQTLSVTTSASVVIGTGASRKAIINYLIQQ